MAGSVDLVFVNLFYVPRGEPMSYGNTYELFGQPAATRGCPARA
ncbi:hypothetical protein ACIBO5_50375 [Nonomuraea angiospora]